MVIKSCINCKFHSVRLEGEEQTSHCERENCWSRYSKCITLKALEKFLEEESLQPKHHLSTLDQMHS